MSAAPVGNTGRVTEVVIVGGGTAGWMTAAALAKILSPEYKVCLIESDEIGTVGVGEATIPMIKLYNNALELDENEFIRETKGSFKLGIEFVNWGRLGDSYIHGFGKIGQDLGLLPFYQYWLKMHQAGKAGGLDDYSINTLACRYDKFIPAVTDRPNSPLADIAYAYHFDAGLYARYLRKYAEARGVRRIEGKIASVEQHPHSGFVEAVTLESGERVGGQLFVDCSGFRGLLIEQTLQTGYVDWTHWLPCDRAVAVQCTSGDTITPYTRSTAREAGWQWRIPLQHRVGNGYVFSSPHISEDEATAVLMRNLEGQPLTEPRVLRFVTGKRKKFWNKNVVAIGLSSGFMEPLESTSIHLIQSGIARLSAFFPHAGFDQVDIDEFNDHANFEFDKIRDFLILHYHATERDDTPMWNYCRTMSIPESLTRKIELFRSNGRVFREGNELFAEPSWVQVMYGQRIHPQSYHALVDVYSEAKIAEYMAGIRGVIANCVKVMPRHEAYIAKYCAASM
ncbi:MAG: tryptophan 7-halogenase [Lysobacteraceae bacterium]|nr:MAG: tryptophan 7-halogenase [Xanthomonadaceae bacterium]